MAVHSNVKKSLISLPREMAEELDEMAAVLHKRKSKIVSEALSMYFDYLDIQIAAERAQAHEKGEHRGLTPDEMRNLLLP